MELVDENGTNCPLVEGGFCRLDATSPFKNMGTDGKDPGCDIAILLEKTTVAKTGHRGLGGSIKMSAGSTKGQALWQDYVDMGTHLGIYLDVDTSASGFSNTPIYVSAIGGTFWHYEMTGGSAIYNPSKSGFRVYVRWSSRDAGPNPGTQPDSQFANNNGWYINWIGWEI
ncbi:MAG: hypothetical protein ABJB76_07895 [Candidatus Nitrosocosmicus sp.]